MSVEIIKCYRCGKKPKMQTVHSHFFRVKCDCGVTQAALFNVLENSVRDWNKFQHNFVAKLPPLQNVDASLNADGKKKNAIEAAVEAERMTKGIKREGDAATEDELRKKLVALPNDALITVFDTRRLCKVSTETIYQAVRKNIIPFQLSNDDRKIRLIKKGDAIAWRRANPPFSEKVRASLKDILGEEIETHPSRSASKEEYRKLVLALPDEMMISVFEASSLCKAATCTICRAIKMGILPAVQRKAGRIMYMVKKADAIKWRRNNPPPEKEDKDAIKDILG